MSASLLVGFFPDRLVGNSAGGPGQADGAFPLDARAFPLEALGRDLADNHRRAKSRVRHQSDIGREGERLGEAGLSLLAVGECEFSAVLNNLKESRLAFVEFGHLLRSGPSAPRSPAHFESSTRVGSIARLPA